MLHVYANHPLCSLFVDPLLPINEPQNPHLLRSVHPFFRRELFDFLHVEYVCQRVFTSVRSIDGNHPKEKDRQGTAIAAVIDGRGLKS